MLSPIRETIEIPEYFLQKYIFQMWVAFRAESQKILGGRDKLADYTLNIVRDAERKYKFTLGGSEYAADILSAKTLQNFLNIGEAAHLQIDKIGAFRKKKSASHRTLSYIFIFLFALRSNEVLSWPNSPNENSIDTSTFFDEIEDIGLMRPSYSQFSELHSKPLILLSTMNVASQSPTVLASFSSINESVFTGSHRFLQSAYIVVFLSSGKDYLDTLFCCRLFFLQAYYKARSSLISNEKFVEPLDQFFFQSLGFKNSAITVQDKQTKTYLGQYQGVACKLYNESEKILLQFSNFGDLYDKRKDIGRRIKPEEYHEDSLKYTRPHFSISTKQDGSNYFIPMFLREPDSQYILKICKNYLG